MSQEEILALKRYLQSITERPASIESQPHRREGIFLWCEDWEIIEVLKYLIHGREIYFADPPPRRLRHNPLWNQQKIAEHAEILRQEYPTADQLIDALKARRTYAYA